MCIFLFHFELVVHCKSGLGLGVGLSLNESDLGLENGFQLIYNEYGQERIKQSKYCENRASFSFSFFFILCLSSSTIKDDHYGPWASNVSEPKENILSDPNMSSTCNGFDDDSNVGSVRVQAVGIF